MLKYIPIVIFTITVLLIFAILKIIAPEFFDEADRSEDT